MGSWRAGLGLEPGEGGLGFSVCSRHLYTAQRFLCGRPPWGGRKAQSTSFFKFFSLILPTAASNGGQWSEEANLEAVLQMKVTVNVPAASWSPITPTCAKVSCLHCLMDSSKPLGQFTLPYSHLTDEEAGPKLACQDHTARRWRAGASARVPAPSLTASWVSAPNPFGIPCLFCKWGPGEGVV